jgi:enoyl-CoA hydratase
MKLEKRGDVALLRIAEGKANAIGPAWLTEMNRVCDELPASRARALVVTGEGSAFSAGLDLPSLLPFDEAEMRAFIARFSQTMLRLFELPLPVVAAVNGHAVAGGCVLAIQADVRLMTERSCFFGLNEVVLGIGLPAVVVETLRCQVPASSLLPVALEGRLFGPADALRLGLVHELVAPDALEARALARAEELASLPATAARQVKAALRRPVVEAIRAAGDGDAQRWTGIWFTDEGRRLVREAVARIQKR